MARITEVARLDGMAYGVYFVVCGNGEVAGEKLGVEDREKALRMMTYAALEVGDSGYDFERCGDFRAYNGGPRRDLVEAIYCVADLDDDETPEADLDWRETWQRGAGATEIPSEVSAIAEKVIESAYRAMR